MRVLFLASYFPKPDNSTMGTWALGQARALARQPIDLRVLSFTSYVPRLLARTPGARAYAACPPRHDWNGLTVEYPRWLYYPVPPLKAWAYRDPRRQMALAWRSARPRLLRELQQQRPQVIFCHHTLPNGYMAHRLSLQTGVPYVVTDHDFGEVADGASLPHRRDCFGPVLRGASCVVAVAHRMQRDFEAIYPGVRVRTIHNGIDLPPPSAPPAPRPPELAGKKVISCAAMFAPRKGLPLLIEALARVAPRHPDAVLRIVGDGVERPAVERAIQTFNLRDRVTLLGLAPHERVLQEMAWSDFFALVGWDEPFATVFIEAMGCGKPIVTCDDGGINDVVRHEVHGLTVPPRDLGATAAALDRLLSDQPLRLRMGQEAQRLVETQLTWDANARRMVELFHEAAANRR